MLWLSSPYKSYLFLKIIWNTAWDLEEWLFADVTPDVRTLFPWAISRNTSSALVIVSSLRPTTCTCCLWSSSTRNFCFLFNKSNTCKMFYNKCCLYTQHVCFNFGKVYWLSQSRTLTFLHWKKRGPWNCLFIVHRNKKGIQFFLRKSCSCEYK